jgi:acetyl-CoA carboxylase beta subunit
MVFLTKCPRCNSREVLLQQDLKGRYWRCPKCQHVEQVTDAAPVAPGRIRQPR